MSQSTLCTVLLCLVMTACAGSEPAPEVPFDLEATRALIAEKNQRFTEAHLTGDLATIDSMFTEDAKSYPPGADVLSGLPAIHAFTVEYVELGLAEFREETTDFYGNADVVVDAGTYTVTYGAEQITERGKYLNVWQRVDGEWKMRSNMWNADAPLPASN